MLVFHFYLPCFNFLLTCFLCFLDNKTDLEQQDIPHPWTNLSAKLSAVITILSVCTVSVEVCGGCFRIIDLNFKFKKFDIPVKLIRKPYKDVTIGWVCTETAGGIVPPRGAFHFTLNLSSF